MLIVKNSRDRGDSLTSLQKEALRATSKGQVLGSGKSTYELIKFYQPIFDKLFFLGSLKGRLKVTATGKWANREGNYGWANFDSQRRDKAKIAVNTMMDNGQNRILRHMGTSLHEMIQGFLLIYMVPRYNKERRLFNNGHGYTGHGSAWHDIAYALEKASDHSTLMDIKLPMGRDVALWGEMVQAQTRGEKIDPNKWGLGQNRRRNPGNMSCSTCMPGGQLNPGGQLIPGGQMIQRQNNSFGIHIMGPGWQQFIQIPYLSNIGVQL